MFAHIGESIGIPAMTFSTSHLDYSVARIVYLPIAHLCPHLVFVRVSPPCILLLLPSHRSSHLWSKPSPCRPHPPIPFNSPSPPSLSTDDSPPLSRLLPPKVPRQATPNKRKNTPNKQSHSTAQINQDTSPGDPTSPPQDVRPPTPQAKSTSAGRSGMRGGTKCTSRMYLFRGSPSNARKVHSPRNTKY
jgi:hypothetical protein